MNAPAYRYARAWLALGWSLVAAVIVLSLVPLPLDLSGGRDKAGHFLAYGSLTFWFGMLYAGRGRQLGIALAFAALGVMIEFLQRLTSYRSFEVADMIANAIGAGIGWFLVQTPLRHALTQVERLIAAAIQKT